MRTALFARPNLKLFVVFALGVLAVQHWLNAHGSGSARMSALYVPECDAIDELVARCFDDPTPENYLWISECYRRCGDPTRAMRYIRKAHLAAEIEGD